MSIEAVEAVIDLIEMGAMANQEDIVKCLRSAIREPETQEPVAWMQGTGLYWPDDAAIGEPDCEPLYTAPPQREWQGLTDEEVMSLLPGAVRLPPGWVDTVRAIEAKLREKNG
jgi:hypothetical protein